jgi:hypothetical protein
VKDPFGIGPIEPRDTRFYRALQLIPADGWLAECSREDGTATYYPLACWALVESFDGEYQAVVGLEPSDGGLEPSSVLTNFVRYIHRSGIPASATSESEADERGG